jgi:death-on-curing protein
VAIAWQDRLMERYGGARGLRDPGLLESALARPQNLAAYNPDATVEALAALYGVGLAKAHGFIDGNKRIAFAVMVSFLRVHGHVLDIAEREATQVMLGVAAGEIGEDELAGWLAAHCRRGR